MIAAQVRFLRDVQGGTQVDDAGRVWRLTHYTASITDMPALTDAEAAAVGLPWRGAPRNPHTFDDVVVRYERNAP